jgi:hypothetical protein
VNLRDFFTYGPGDSWGFYFFVEEWKGEKLLRKPRIISHSTI